MSWPQGHSAARRIMSMKNSNDTIGNRTRDLPACSAVPQPTAPPAACPNLELEFTLNLYWEFNCELCLWTVTLLLNKQKLRNVILKGYLGCDDTQFSCCCGGNFCFHLHKINGAVYFETLVVDQTTRHDMPKKGGALMKHTKHSWRIKDQLVVTCYFISLLMCSTCFGH